jgi:hypothetical protein
VDAAIQTGVDNPGKWRADDGEIFLLLQPIRQRDSAYRGHPRTTV